MKKTLYISTFCVITLFLGASPTGIENQAIASESHPEVKVDGERLSEELESLRINNNVTLKYIHFKAKYGNYQNFYIQNDSAK